MLLLTLLMLLSLMLLMLAGLLVPSTLILLLLLSWLMALAIASRGCRRRPLWCDDHRAGRF